MSDFIPALVDLLPEHNSLKNPNNQLRKVLDTSVGEWFDQHNIQDFYDGLFITTAVGKYLDLHGRDYGVYRKNDESDDDYRIRIVQEKLEHLTPDYLETLYGLRLYVYVSQFDVANNTLTSDNKYINRHMAFNIDGIKDILNKKFIVDNSLIWINDDGSVDYLIDYATNNDIILNYLTIYDLTSLRGYFAQSGLKKVKLNLPLVTDLYHSFYMSTRLTDIDLTCESAVDCTSLLSGCTSLENVKLTLPSAVECSEMVGTGSEDLTDLDLDLPKAENCNNMVGGCFGLENVKLNLPSMTSFSGIFANSDALETINVTIPSGKVNDFKSYVLGLELTNLSSFIVNGEEVDLS